MPTPQEEAKAKQDAIDKANAEAAETYKAQVGKTFTNGKFNATVEQYVPSHNGKTGPRQCFLVHEGHKHVRFFRPCKEFMNDFQPVVADKKGK